MGKHPLTKNGVKDASTKISQIEKWWEKWPEANIGIATGVVSGIWVLDIDKDTNKREIQDLIANHRLRVITGKGTHLYFAADKQIKSKVGLWPSIDIRGDGGYVVAPPSLHANGAEYRWAKT